MYAGEVNVAQDQLPQFLKTAERLKVSKIIGSSEKLWLSNNAIAHFKTIHYDQTLQVKGLAEAPQNVKDE